MRHLSFIPAVSLLTLLIIPLFNGCRKKLESQVCFGAVGKNCNGFGDLLAVGPCSEEVEGKRNCWVTPASIKYANCALQHSQKKQESCKQEWDEMTLDVQTGRAWMMEMDSKHPADFTSVSSQRYPAGEVKSSITLCAPGGSNLLAKHDVTFCCSGEVRHFHKEGVEDWMLCKAEKKLPIQKSVGSTKSPSAKPPHEKTAAEKAVAKKPVTGKEQPPEWVPAEPPRQNLERPLPPPLPQQAQQQQQQQQQYAPWMPQPSPQQPAPSVPSASQGSGTPGQPGWERPKPWVPGQPPPPAQHHVQQQQSQPTPQHHVQQPQPVYHAPEPEFVPAEQSPPPQREEATYKPPQREAPQEAAPPPSTGPCNPSIPKYSQPGCTE